MASLKELQNSIKSVKATQKITKAMQMVAAAKLRRAQEAAEAGRPYAQRMETILGNLNARVSSKEGASPLLIGTGKTDKHLLVVATAERGLCGGFNGNIAKKANVMAQALLADGKDVKILCIGHKGRDVLKAQHQSRLLDVIDMRDIKTVAFSDAHAMAKQILARFDAKEFDVCTLFYSEFQSVISQIPTALQLIPAQMPEVKEEAPVSNEPDSPYDYEPDETEILNNLLPLNIGTQIFRALLENAASEQGARMSAMDNATRNAGDRINDLTLIFNRTRQAQITSELIEIISGAEAV